MTQGVGDDQAARGPAVPDNRLAEWSECRTTIGRMDGILADIRKYGFSLVSLLLTASALITTSSAVADRVAASSVVIVLVLVLFLMDRYWWVLLRNAAHRANQLERLLGIRISQDLGNIAHRSHNTLAASLVYGIFVLVACGVALVTVAPRGLSFALWFMVGLTVLALVVIAVLHMRIERLLPREESDERDRKRRWWRGGQRV